MHNKIVKGIKHSNRAFCGPHTVQIDLTDRCNNSCIACWVHSPLINKIDVFPEGQKEIPIKVIKKLICELYKSGTKEIILSGSGEPLMYPEILGVIRLIKSKKINLNIITNATLLTDEISRMFGLPPSLLE